MKLILDCDSGHDDALALRLLCAGGAELLGVSTCFGGFGPKKAAIQAEIILKEYGKSVPVCAGATCALTRQRGPVHCAEDIPWRGREMASGAFLRELLERTDDPVTLLATGPLTNVAAMLRSASRWPEHIYIMGGGICGGNRTSAAEFNFWCDPEAANEVLQSGCPVTLLPLEAARDCALAAQDIAKLSPGAGDDLRAQMEFSRRTGCGNYAIVYDAVAAAAVLDPSILAETRQCACRVDCSETENAGALLLSPLFGSTMLVEYADPNGFRRVFASLLSTPIPVRCDCTESLRHHA